jgi:hypothetical protein
MPKQFALPELNKQIDVTTRHRNIFYYNEDLYDEYSYTGTVGRNDSRAPEGSFVLLSNDPIMPIRVIALRNVIKLKYKDGTAIQKKEQVTKIWQVKGSKGQYYTITKDGGKINCSCPGFQFRKTCKHTQEK